jgi:two-component system, OmpR family, sensor kinase
VRLRRRLTLTMAALLILALSVADVVTYTTVRSFLLGRLDAQLDVAQHQAFNYLYAQARAGRPPSESALDARVSPDVYLLLVSPDGSISLARPSGSDAHPDPRPVLPSALKATSAPRARIFGRRGGVFRPEANSYTVSARGDGGAQYRASAVEVPQGVLVTAVSLNPTSATLSLLVGVELGASLAVLAAICILALWTVRRGLRPLEDMAKTAGEIADGDLRQRVPIDDEQSEVGRLGRALNFMLARIEAAFSEKSASEARLRQFVADASHELRTPLTSIRGYTELLRKGAFSDEESRQRALSRVEREAIRMGTLVDDLLLLARLDQGRPLARVTVDLRRVGADAVDDARAVEPARPVELIAPAPVVVMGDPDRLGQVAHNLVRNALAHTPAGTPVRVQVSAEGGMGRLQVSDEGPGLDPLAATRVFDRFYRGDLARTGDGTGLGLAIVRAIAEALSGTAFVRSEPGAGATFVVDLPLGPAGVRRSAPPPDEAADAGAAGVEPVPVTGRLTS